MKNITKYLYITLLAFLFLLPKSNLVFASEYTNITTKDFDLGMKKGIDYFNRGLYYEAKDEFRWFKDGESYRMNVGQKNYLNNYIAATDRKIALLKSANVETDKYNIHKFSVVNSYNGDLYCSYDISMIGAVNTEICNPLPYGLHNLGTIYSFAIYNGYIYYLTGGLGSDILPCSIYRCDLNGKNNIYIADNTYNHADLYIVDDVLYYSIAETIDGNVRPNGIGKIDLKNNTYEQIYQMNRNFRITYCNKNYIFIKTNKWNEDDICFSIDHDGNYVNSLSNNYVEIFNECINRNYAYNFYDGAVYKYDWNRNSTWLFNTVRKIGDDKLRQDSGRVVNVISNKVYYTIQFDTRRGFSYKVNTLLLRCDMDGNNVELIGICFNS